MVTFRQELASEKHRKSKHYGDTDVTSQIKTHDQNFASLLSLGNQIMLKQLFRHQNKEESLITEAVLTCTHNLCFEQK